MNQKWIPCFVSHVLAVVVLSACVKNDKQYEQFAEAEATKLHSTRCISSWKDTIFPQIILGMTSNANYLFLSDTKRDQVYQLTPSLELVHILGKSGKGPGEFIGNFHLFATQDSVFVYDGTQKRISVFRVSSGEYLTSISIPDGVRFSSRFTIDPYGNIYLPTPRAPTSVVKIDQKGKILARFGKSTQNLKAIRHLFATEKGEILGVVAATGMLERYDSTGKLLEQYDLNQFPKVHASSDHIQKLYQRRQYSWRNYYFSIISDAHYTSGRLYLLVRTHPPGASDEELMLGSTIFQINTVNGFTLSRIWKLCELNDEDCSYLSLCVSADQSSLLAYELFSGQICTFSLPEATQE